MIRTHQSKSCLPKSCCKRPSCLICCFCNEYERTDYSFWHKRIFACKVTGYWEESKEGTVFLGINHKNFIKCWHRFTCQWSIISVRWRPWRQNLSIISLESSTTYMETHTCKQYVSYRDFISEAFIAFVYEWDSCASKNRQSI